MHDRLAARPQAFFVAGALGISVALAAPLLSVSATSEPDGPAGAVALVATLDPSEPDRLTTSVDSFAPDGELGAAAALGAESAALGAESAALGAESAALGAASVEAEERSPAEQAETDRAGTDTAAGRREVAGCLAPGRTLAQCLGDQGIGPAGVHEIVAALSSKYDFRRAPADARWDATLSPTGDAVDRFRFVPSPRETLSAARDASGRLVGQRDETPVDVRAVRVDARIDTSLYEAIEQAGESPSLAALIADVFAWDLDFSRDQQAGDSFRMLVEKRYVNGRFLEYGRVLAAEYAGRKGTFRAFWFQPDGGRGRYYLEDGRSAEKVFLATPLEYTRVSSRFDRHRKHPILGFTRAHNGTDFAAPRGTPVRAMADGVVTFAGRKGGSGKLVVIRHDSGLESYYAHLDRIESSVRAGRRVGQKEMIGRVGSTGLATGPHLHLGIKQRGSWIDPQKLKITRSEPLPERYRASFRAMVAERVALMETPAPETARAALGPDTGRQDLLGEMARP